VDASRGVDVWPQTYGLRLTPPLSSDSRPTAWTDCKQPIDLRRRDLMDSTQHIVGFIYAGVDNGRCCVTWCVAGQCCVHYIFFRRRSLWPLRDVRRSRGCPACRTKVPNRLCFPASARTLANRSSTRYC